MGNIKLDNLGDRGEDWPPEDDRGEEETMFDDNWHIRENDNPSVREGLKARRRADRELGVGLGLRKRAYIEDKKNLIRTEHQGLFSKG